MAIKLTPKERELAEWAVEFMRDLDDEERIELYGRADVVMPTLGGDTLTLGDADTTADLLYRVEEQYADVADAAYLHGESGGAIAGQQRVSANLAQKIRSAA